LFSLWGFANDITNPMVAAFKNILLISNFESSLVQFAFYGGYCVMAIPASLFIKRFSYKTGILIGLVLYAAGCLLFIPSGYMMAFWAFLVSYFIMTCGLSFLETSANPYILSMGPEETSTRRLNFAQSFNPMGSIIGMLVARNFILARLDKADEATRKILQETTPEKFTAMQQHDLGVIIGPYAILGIVVLAVLIVFAIAKLAIETGLWVNYEMLDSKVTKAKKVMRKPVEEYLKTQKRFRHLFKPKRQDAEIAAIQAIADRNAEKYAQIPLTPL